MAKFDMGAAWDDAVVLLRSHLPLTGTIAAVFLFLPTLFVSWLGPVTPEPPAGATVEQIVALFQTSMREMLPYQLAVAIVSAVGGIAILRLWLARTGTSVGDALGFAAMLVPTMIVVQILLGLALGIGFLLLIVPGLYLWGRLALVSPAIADSGIRNPIAALQESWQLTRGNGWRLFLFLFLVTIVIFIVAMILGGILVAVAGAAGDGVGRLLTGLVEGGVTGAGGLVSLAVTAAAYRQLAIRGAQETFG